MATSYHYRDTKSNLGSIELDMNFGNLIDDTDEANVIIDVGGENNLDFKSFKAHSLVLCERSTYFRIALSDKWAKKEKDFYILKKPNVAPKIFEVILKFMYYGSVSLEHLDGPDSIALLIASDELELRKLCIHVQTHIKNTLNDWLGKNLMLILDITSKHEDFDILREHVLGIVCRDPHLIFGVRVPYKKILPKQLNEDIIKYFMKPGCELTTRILPSRLTIIDSTIIKAIHAGLISSWIDGIVHDNDRDYENAVNSFVFSFNVNDDLKIALLSKVVMANNAIYYSTSNGPCFGDGDLWMTGTFGSSSRTSYEHSIMDVPNFFANDYEVFQVQQR
ncbi:10120_t:CDS:2 [Dentiscutata heterogama]|uniref:10120_t:CDS:1 n=1 Tax=Dentiscutata heterogama TaxID=1316150 RepID=A0ACA9LJ81_9GLOM|nr:10120_t:CDS:2 [Dentiscutata heterogama]